MKKCVICGFLACITLVFFFASPSSASAASAEEEVLQVITTFVTAMNERDTDLLNSLRYQDPKTTIFGPSGRFLKHESSTTTPPSPFVFWDLNYPEVTMLGDNAAVITGYFTLNVTGSETQAMTVEYLRVTLVVQKIKKKWLIVHEHTSHQP